ncbi:MAG: hypothetical protein AB8B35_05655 [Prochlorococcus sp.]
MSQEINRAKQSLASPMALASNKYHPFRVLQAFCSFGMKLQR